MPEIKLTPKQRENIGKLLNTAAKDKDVQGQLVADPHAVLAKYGLENLVKGHDVHVGLDITTNQREVKVGKGVTALFGWHIDANTGHADAEQHFDISRPHADGAQHADTAAGHADLSHQDFPALHLDI